MTLDIEQLQWLNDGPHPHTGVEETRLVCDLPDGVGGRCQMRAIMEIHPARPREFPASVQE